MLRPSCVLRHGTDDVSVLSPYLRSSDWRCVAGAFSGVIKEDGFLGAMRLELANTHELLFRSIANVLNESKPGTNNGDVCPGDDGWSSYRGGKVRELFEPAIQGSETWDVFVGCCCLVCWPVCFTTQVSHQHLLDLCACSPAPLCQHFLTPATFRAL